MKLGKVTRILDRADSVTIRMMLHESIDGDQYHCTSSLVATMYCVTALTPRWDLCRNSYALFMFTIFSFSCRFYTA